VRHALALLPGQRSIREEHGAVVLALLRVGAELLQQFRATERPCDRRSDAERGARHRDTLERMAVTTTRRAIVRMPAGSAPTSVPDDLAVEDPLVLGMAGDAIATLMRTPGHDLELVAGWLVVESGVRRADDILTLRACREDDTDRVHISLRVGVRPPRPRAFVTSAACGVCSADVLDLTLVRTSAPHRAGSGPSTGPALSMRLPWPA
jgi:hypothetical protein